MLIVRFGKAEERIPETFIAKLPGIQYLSIDNDFVEVPKMGFLKSPRLVLWLDDQLRLLFVFLRFLL